MRDVGGACGQENSPSEHHVGLALDVIGRLLERRMCGVAKLKPDLLNRLVDLAVDQATGAGDTALSLFRAQRVPAEVMASVYIPEAARMMGQRWVADSLSFAQVTVGTARLQEMLHLLQPELSADQSDPTNASSVLLIVPPGEQHTLGALVATLELRRMGVSVSLQIAPSLSDLSRLLSLRSFDGVLITLGSAERVEICTKLVNTLKQLSKGRLRVAIGGAAAEVCRAALLGSGADLVTASVKIVLSEFGLNKADTNRAEGGDGRASA